MLFRNVKRLLLILIARYVCKGQDAINSMPIDVVIHFSHLINSLITLQNHISVITQMHGSIFPKVIPYCLTNCFITLIIFYMKKYLDIDWTFSDKGHTFMSAMVSFLVVTRTSIAYTRFTEARDFLDKAMFSTRELIQHIICFTRYDDSGGQLRKQEIQFDF